MCTVTAGISKYKSFIKKKKMEHDKIVLLGKEKLDTLKGLIFKAVIDSYMSHNKFVLVNNILWECNELKEKIGNPKTSVKYTI